MVRKLIDKAACFFMFLWIASWCPMTFSIQQRAAWIPCTVTQRRRQLQRICRRSGSRHTGCCLSRPSSIRLWRSAFWGCSSTPPPDPLLTWCHLPAPNNKSAFVEASQSVATTSMWGRTSDSTRITNAFRSNRVFEAE